MVSGLYLGLNVVYVANLKHNFDVFMNCFNTMRKKFGIPKTREEISDFVTSLTVHDVETMRVALTVASLGSPDMVTRHTALFCVLYSIHSRLCSALDVERFGNSGLSIVEPKLSLIPEGRLSLVDVSSFKIRMRLSMLGLYGEYLEQMDKLCDSDCESLNHIFSVLVSSNSDKVAFEYVFRKPMFVIGLFDLDNRILNILMNTCLDYHDYELDQFFECLSVLQKRDISKVCLVLCEAGPSVGNGNLKYLMDLAVNYELRLVVFIARLCKNNIGVSARDFYGVVIDKMSVVPFSQLNEFYDFLESSKSLTKCSVKDVFSVLDSLVSRLRSRGSFVERVA